MCSILLERVLEQEVHSIFERIGRIIATSTKRKKNSKSEPKDEQED
jgi:hypothetical protein